MAQSKGIRLMKAAKEFNIGKDTLIQFLLDKNFKVLNKPNTILSDEMYDELLQEYALDKAAKWKSESIRLEVKTENLDKKVFQNEINANKNKTVANLAHGLKTPLGVYNNDIKNIFLSLESEGDFDLDRQLKIGEHQSADTYRQIFQRIENKYQELLVRIEDGINVEKGFDTISLEDELLSHRKYIKQVGFEFIWQIRSNDTPTARVNRKSLKKAIETIIENALNHGGFEQDAKKKIYICLINLSDVYDIYILNNGKEKEHELSEKTYSKRGKKIKSNGNGIGGSIVNDFIQEHKGTFKIMSKESCKDFLKKNEIKEHFGFGIKLSIPRNKDDETSLDEIDVW